MGTGFIGSCPECVETQTMGTTGMGPVSGLGPGLTGSTLGNQPVNVPIVEPYRRHHFFHHRTPEAQYAMSQHGAGITAGGLSIS